MTSAPGVPGVIVVERGGRIRLVQGRKRRTFTSIAGNVSTGGERGLLSVAFAPDYAASRLLYVYFTNGAGDLVIAELRADADGRHADPATCGRSSSSPTPTSRTTTAVSSSSGPTACSTRAPGTAAAQAINLTTPRTRTRRLGKLLRINPASGAVQDLLARAAQPLPLLLRPGHGLRLSRGSRSATSARTASMRSTTCRSRRPPGPTSAGTTSRGSPRSRGRHPPTPEPNGEADRGPQHLRRRLRDHRRLRGPRLAAAAALPPLCLRRLLHAARSAPWSPRLGGARKNRGTGLRVSRPELVRRDRRRHALRHLAEWPGLPLRPQR